MEPPSLAGIFSVDSDSGLMIVDGTGPHLLAAGALGYVKVNTISHETNYISMTTSLTRDRNIIVACGVIGTNAV